MKKLLLKSLLVAAGLCVGAMSSWAVDVPTPVYTQNFESASTELGSAGSNFGITGATLTGAGAIQTGDPKFGKYYKNASGVGTQSSRANYLTLMTTAFSNMTSPEATTISFWINAYEAWANYWGSIFVAYNSTGNSAHGYPFSFDTRACLATHSNLYETYFDNNGVIINEWRTSGADFASSWHHVALVYSLDKTDPSAPKVVIKQYIDGISKQEFSMGNGNSEHPEVSMFDHFEQLTEFVIGGNSPVWEDPDNNYAYDEITIYDQALTSEQIAQIVNNKLGTKYSWTATAYATINELKTQIDTWNASEVASEGQSYNVWAKKVIKYNDKYYELADNKFTGTNLYFSETMGNANANHEITYVLNENIAYFAEGEDLYSDQQKISETSSGGKYTYYLHGTKDASIANAGVYRMETVVLDRSANNGLFVYASDNTMIGEIARNCGNGNKQTANFLISNPSSPIKIGLSGNNNTLSFDYVLIRKMFDITDASNIVGNVDNSSTSGTSSDYTLKKGETKVFSFQNHGQDYSNNWRINVIEDNIWKSVTRADSWDEKGGDAGTGAATKVSYMVSRDGGNTKVNLNWDEYKADMADAHVVATLAYGLDGTLAITTTSTGAANGYIYYVDQDVTGLTSELTINLSVYNSWLEVLSVEQTSVGVTIASSGYSSLASAFGLDFANATGLTAAYVVTNTTNDAVTLTSVDELPANSGVILKGESGATYSIPVKADAAYNGTNLLSPAVTATSITANSAYILQGGQFRLVTADSEVPAGKAYLLASNVPDAARALGFMFSDEVEGISAVSLDKQNGEFYNLQGQRVDSPKKGLYIVNGTKVIIK